MANDKLDSALSENAAKVAIKLFKEIGEIAEQKGTRLTTIVTGIVILILILLKNVIVSKTASVNIDYIDLTLLICAVFICLNEQPNKTLVHKKII